MMTLTDELVRHFSNHFRILILDNEVTVPSFVVEPPVPWIRLYHLDGLYSPVDVYPTSLDDQQAQAETRLWDTVSGLAMIRTLNELDERVDFVAFGNNAGQGMPLADSLSKGMRARNAGIIYGENLAEQAEYESLGYRTFLRRDALIDHVSRLASKAGKAPAIAFINTIQHDETNFHEPWPAGSA